jgi:alkylation response protein AidB-like acyl-CoA dehydrogenase
MSHVYGIPASAAQFVASATEVAKSVAGPRAADNDRGGRFPSESIAALGKESLLGLCVDRQSGGAGEGMRAFCAVTEELAQACASTAMIYVMHVSAQQAIASSPILAERAAILKDIAAGRHLTTLALSEAGSRSQFWAPVSKLVVRGDGFVTSAHKSWITSAHHADSYVASAQQPEAKSALESTVFLARTSATQIQRTTHFDGLGLRGNDSAPARFEELPVGRGDLISDIGAGAKTMLEVVLPWFAVGSAAMAHGLMRAAVAGTVQHLQARGFEHTGTALRDLPNLRARLAQMYVRTEASRALLARTLAVIEDGAADAPLYVLSARRGALDAALEVTDLAMRTCGGAAFSRHLPLERLFRDARAGWVMAPTVDHLDDFIGKALTGLPLF